MKLAAIALATCLMSSTAALAQAPQPLKSSVGWMDPEPELRFAVASHGMTMLARYHSEDPGWYPANEPLVLIVRGQTAEWPDLITVTKAEIDGHNITITLEARHLAGPTFCTKCPPPSAPLVEVHLGPLLPDDYRVVVEHVQLDYKDQGHPERATKGRTWREAKSFRVSLPPPPLVRLP